MFHDFPLFQKMLRLASSDITLVLCFMAPRLYDSVNVCKAAAMKSQSHVWHLFFTTHAARIGCTRAVTKGLSGSESF